MAGLLQLPADDGADVSKNKDEDVEAYHTGEETGHINKDI